MFTQPLESQKDLSYESFFIPIFPDDLPSPPSLPLDIDKTALRKIDSDAIKPCKYKYTYIWFKCGHEYWMWLTYVGKKSIAGFIWLGFEWAYFGTDLDNIDSFICF